MLKKKQGVHQVVSPLFVVYYYDIMRYNLVLSC